ncbi:hypothetical protein QYE76_035265 [Lolium multiflorum]|uniref:CCHC-type domain-containing protein n=1 Tax=Lolium multiflorum TaxID=4521 RepID=A0AAD8R0K2_LOLMU|nr:hypothetical protein QYE76_035265 [Lolium multiflorum]
MSNGSPVRTGLGDAGGDFQIQDLVGGGASTSASRVAARGTASAPGRLSACGGGRFWARKSGAAARLGMLDGEGDGSSSGEEERFSSDASSPRRPSGQPTLGGFLERALAGGQGGDRRRRRRRVPFAPGGWPSRFGAPASLIWGLGAPRRGVERPPCPRGRTRGSSPETVALRPSTPAGREPVGLRRPEIEGCVPTAAVSAGLGTVGRPSPGPREEAGPDALEHPLLLLGPPREEDGLGRLRSVANGPVVAQAQPRRWLWLPLGCWDPELGFPARPSERYRRGTHIPFRTLFRIPDPPPLSRSFAEVVAMAGGGGGGGGSGGYGGGQGDGRKRRHDEQGGGRYGFNNNNNGGFFDGSGGGGRADGGGRSDGGGKDDYFYGGRSDGGGRPDFDQGYGGGRQGSGGGRYHDGGGQDGGYYNNPSGRRDGGRQGEERRGQQHQDEQWPHLAEGQRGRAQQGAPRGGGAKGGKLKGVAQGAPPQPKTKGKSKAAGGTASGPVGGECFRCGQEGHFQAECVNDPVCILCSQTGHVSAACPTRGRPLILQSYGHAITGGGFFNIEVEPLKVQAEGELFEAVIHFTSAPLTALQLSDELKSLLDDLWDWQVSKVSDTEFCVRFPSRETLRMSTRRGKIYLPLSKCDVDIREAFVSPRPGPTFPSVWVQITGLPGDLMVKERLMAAMTMIGRPVDDDELSIKKWKTEPVRMRFQCRYPERVKGTIHLCVNGEPFTLGIHAELGAPGAGGSSGPPRPPAPRDDEDGDDLESEGRSTDGEAWNRHRRRGSNKEKAKGTDKTGGGPGASQLKGCMGSRSAPQLGKVADQYGSNLRSFPALASLGRFAILSEVDEGGCPAKQVEGAPRSLLGVGEDETPLVSEEMVSQVTDLVGSWIRDSPTIEAASPVSAMEDMVVVPVGPRVVRSDGGSGQQPGAVMDLHGELTASISLAQGKRTKVVPAVVETTTKRTMRTTVPATPIRKSARNVGVAATSVMKKAQSLAAAKNLELPATTGTDADFSLLPSLSDSHLSSVITDSGMVFAPSSGSPVEALQLVRAKELAQATLAAAAARKARDEQERLAREANVSGVVADAVLDDAPSVASEDVLEDSDSGVQASLGDNVTLRSLRVRARERRPRLTETIRAEFTAPELRSLEVGSQFAWDWVPAAGHSGGMLLGFRDESFEVGQWKKGTFFISASIFQRSNKMKWCFFMVYGPADHRRTEEFLGVLTQAVEEAPYPVVVGVTSTSFALRVTRVTTVFPGPGSGGSTRLSPLWPFEN